MDPYEADAPYVSAGGSVALAHNRTLDFSWGPHSCVANTCTCRVAGLSNYVLHICSQMF